MDDCIANLRSFNDFDAYASEIKHADVCCTLPQSERPEWGISHLLLGDLDIQQGFEGSGNIATGAVLHDGFMIYLQTTGTPGKGNGSQMSYGSALLIAPGEEFCLFAPDAHNWMTVLLPQHLFGQVFDTPQPESAVTFQKVQARSAADRFIRAVHSISQGAEDLLQVHVSAATIYQQRQLLIGHLEDLFEAERAAETRGGGRPRFVNRRTIYSAVEIIESSAGQPLRVPQIAKELGVSERALRDGFRLYLGVSPRQFILLRRLHLARKRFLQARPREVTVSQVARELEMWDVGRFSMRYRKLFGETPMQTLRAPVT